MLTVALGCILASPLLARAEPSAVNPYLQIERLEQARSLGDGQLAQLLHGHDRLLAIRAALAIGRTKDQAGLPLLKPAAGARDTALRGMAVYGIGLIGGSGAARPVLKALTDSSDVVRVAALDATDRLETARVFDTTQERDALLHVRTLLADRDPVVRARAAAALEAFQTGSQAAAALHALVARYRDERSPVVRWHAMWSLYRGYAKVAPPTVLSAGLRDSDEIVRIEAVRAFGKRGDRAAIVALKPLLADPSWRVREQSIEAINVLQGGKPTEHLTQIPAGVQTPSPEIDKLAYLPALPRTPSSGKPHAPDANEIITQPKLDPSTLALFTGPARGPHPRVRIVTTEGNLYLELYPEWASLTVENFLDLANRGYFDGNPWFRIVPDFVVQTGDPSGNGNGDAGYSIQAEENPIEQDSYVISMGLNYTEGKNPHPQRDSAGTQFYITLSPQLHLNRDFTVFGRMVGGFDVLGRLVESDKIVRVERLPDSK